MHWRKKYSLQKMKVGKLNFHMQKNETRHLPVIIYKSQLTVDQRHKFKNLNYETARIKCRWNTIRCQNKQWFSWIRHYQAKPKIDKWIYIKISFCRLKKTITINNDETTWRIWENICKLLIQQDINIQTV
jgi:hypothetical protein